MDPNSLLAKATPELCQLTDRFGNKFYYGNAGDFWHPPFPIGADTNYRAHAQKIRQLEIRDDDVIISSFPKSGLHWRTEIVRMLIEGSAEYAPDYKNMITALDFSPAEVAAQKEYPRILISHYPYRHVPKQIWETKAKVIRLVRDFKDVLVSYYCHLKANAEHLAYNGTFEEFVHLSLECGFCYGDVFDYHQEWLEGIAANPQVQVFTSKYEDLVKCPVEEISRLNDYLGLGRSPALIQEIANACQFQKLKVYKDATRAEGIKATFKDPSSSFYRKGIVGDWKNWFTPDLLDYYNKVCEERKSSYLVQYDQASLNF